MPLFRFVNPTPDTEDATYERPVNPDPERYVEVVDKPTKAPAAKTADPESEEN